MFSLKQGGSLLLQPTASDGLTLLSILKIMLLKISTFSLTLLFNKDMFQLYTSIALLISIYIAVKENLSKTWWMFNRFAI